MGERPRDLLSLGDWLDVARDADVPYVDAELVAEAQTNDVRLFDCDDDSARNERLRALWQTIKDADQPDSILRWDICSSGALKSAMAQPGDGSRPQMWKGTPTVEFDDPRLQDVIDDWRHPTLRIWRRPWVRAAIVDGYPVEFRVFVRDDRVVGVSSYYPQRPLARLWLEEVAHVEQFARLLIAAAGRMTNWRIADCGLDPDRLHCTLDFLVRPAAPFVRQSITFLEGGPPHVGGKWGAHPCCFRDGEVRGIALRDLNRREAEKPADLVDLVRRLPRGPGADVRTLPAGGAGEHRIVLDFAEPWRELMAELRAFQGHMESLGLWSGPPSSGCAAMVSESPPGAKPGGGEAAVPAGDGASRIVELFVHGAARGEKADLLELVAVLLGAHGIEPVGPVDREACRLDVLLPADWRDLPIAREIKLRGAS